MELFSLGMTFDGSRVLQEGVEQRLVGTHWFGMKLSPSDLSDKNSRFVEFNN